MRINALAEIREKEIEYWTTGNRFLENDINVLYSQYHHILDVPKEAKHQKMWKMFQQIQKISGLTLNPKEETLLNVYDRRDSLIEEAKESEARLKEASQRQHQNI